MADEKQTWDTPGHPDHELLWHGSAIDPARQALMAKRDAFYQATNPGQIEEVNYTSAPLMPTDNPELTPEAEAAVGVLQRQWGSDYASKVQSLEIGRQHYLAGHEEDIKSLEKDYPGIGNDPRLINGIVRLVEAGRLKKD